MPTRFVSSTDLRSSLSLQSSDIAFPRYFPDKHAIENIAAALGTISPFRPTSSTDTPTSTLTVEFNFEPPLAPSGLSKPKPVSLRIDDCNLPYSLLELLGKAVRNSPLQHISLCNNHISSQSAMALAIVIKDHPDAISQYNISPASRPPPGSPVQGQLPLSLVPPTSTDPYTGHHLRFRWFGRRY